MSVASSATRLAGVTLIVVALLGASSQLLAQTSEAKPSTATKVQH